MAIGYANFRFKENNGKSSSTQLRVLGNVADAVLLVVDAQLRTITLGASTSLTKTLDVELYTPDNTVPPVTAQRGQKLLFTGLGTDGNTYTFTVGTADPSIISAVGSDIVDLADIADVVAAIEAAWVDDQEGAITVTGCRYVNHNIQ